MSHPKENIFKLFSWFSLDPFCPFGPQLSRFSQIPIVISSMHCNLSDALVWMLWEIHLSLSRPPGDWSSVTQGVIMTPPASESPGSKAQSWTYWSRISGVVGPWEVHLNKHPSEILCTLETGNLGVRKECT